MQTASSSTSSRRWKYDVFLNFRGEDTRKSFIDHLYTAFNQKGLRVFRDDKELERGKPISPELLHAIEESSSAVVVFSRNYASSTWCLDELVQIVHCKNTKFFPVFYNVDPSVVRKQTGEFQEAFVKHEETFREDIGKVQTWRNALTEVANHSGFDLKDGYESQFIQEIVKELSSKLCFSKYTSVEDLVGIDSRMKKLKKFISTESHDVRMIGIYGMGGLGKTTVARVAYELISCEFEGSSFLANVTEISKKDGLLSLQKMLLSKILDMRKDDINIYNVFDGISMIRSRLGCKKILIVVDDVNNPEQLENLVGKHDWFGIGSRIIITSRNKRLLTSHGVDGVYAAEKLNDDEALQLFISKAFRKHQPPERFRELSKCVVQYASGLPLALKVLGCFLCGREVHIWEDALERLKRDCKKEILDILQISFDGLEESEKKIFLDIACFFKGKDRHYVTRILESCGFFPNVGIDTLIDKSLISLHKGILWMHDLIEQMGQQIVKKECLEEPGKRSRLWMEADIRHVLTEKTGTGVVEGIMLKFPDEEIHCCAKAFSKMINLRLLKICNVQLPEGLDYLPNNLRLLDWEGYPLKSLPPNLQLNKIVELKMDQSRIQQLQQGIKTFNNLKSISFKECKHLIKTPDFTFAPNLEEVILQHCTMLREIHPSLLVHKKIINLEMMLCTSLTTLPNQIHMESLKALGLFSCYKLENFPEIVGSMDCLRTLYLGRTGIKVLPMSIERLNGLKDFNLEGCRNLVSLPVTINGLESLTIFSFSGCSQLDNLPKTLGQVAKLRTLEVRKTAIRRPMASTLPTLSGSCTSLISLILSDCNMEEETIPNDFLDSFTSLRWLDLSKNNFVSLPGSIKHLSKLRFLYLFGCMRLRSLPELPSNIEYIDVNECVALETTSNALRLCNSKLSEISCFNCFELICCNNLTSSMPREFLKAMSKPTGGPQTSYPHPIDTFGMIIPGSEIPEWFQHQTETSSIKIERPPNSYDNKMVGYAVCCVFDVHEHQPTRSEGYYIDSYRIDCIVHLCDHSHLRDRASIYFHEISGKALSDHLWLLYFSAKELNQDFFELSFELSGPGLQMQKYGIHPVYEKEIEELKPRAKKSSSSSFWNSYELDEDFLRSKADVDCDGEEDEDVKYFSANDEPSET